MLPDLMEVVVEAGDAFVAEAVLECLDALTRTLRQFISGGRRVADSAFHLIARHAQRRPFAQQRRNRQCGFLHRIQLRKPRAAHGDMPCFHGGAKPTPRILAGNPSKVQNDSLLGEEISGRLLGRKMERPMRIELTPEPWQVYR